MSKLLMTCTALACGAALVISIPAAAQSKMTKQQAVAACQQEIGRGTSAGGQQRELKMCVRAKMGTVGKKK